MTVVSSAETTHQRSCLRARAVEENPAEDNLFSHSIFEAEKVNRTDGKIIFFTVHE
jgi:hypothetical protein